MGAAHKVATYEDLCRVPAPLVAELVSGVLHTQPRPHPRHVLSTTRLSRRIGDTHDTGPGDRDSWIILVEPELQLGSDVLVPDLAGWRRERLPQMPEAVSIRVVPDWICEVLSPGTMRHDRVVKMPLYAPLGVAHLWLLDPQAQILEAFALHEGRWVLLGSAVADDLAQFAPFVDLQLKLAELWCW